LKIGGNHNGEVHNGVIEVLSSIVMMSLLLLVLLPVFLLLKKSIPRGKCILAQVGEVRGDILLCGDYVIILLGLPELLFRTARPKWGLGYFAFCTRSLIAVMNSLGLSSNIKQMVASTKVSGWE
jgi:hypothetical protein